MVDLLLMLLTSQLATLATHQLILWGKWDAIRVSAGLTVAFISLTYFLPYASLPDLHAIFLGSSFVGMSEPQRLSKVQLMFASLFFCLIFSFLRQHFGEYGGLLGLSAFSACILTYFIWSVGKKKAPVREP